MINENAGDVENLVQAHTIGQVTVHQQVAEALRAEQFPPAPALFVDREDETAQLDAALAAEREPDRPLCVLISGGSGSGKSALAMRWVRSVRERFTDGQVYLDLRGRPVDLDEVLLHCLRGLGEEHPGSLDAALGLYRSCTSGRRVALVFDDVVDPRTLLQLLPASSEALVVLIAQRRMRELVVDGVLPLELRRLDRSAGVDLLRAAGGERVAAEAGQAERVVELCGGLPIALRIIARRLARRPGLRLARIVRELEDDRLDRLAEDGVPVLRDSLNRAVDELPGEQRELYRLLGGFPGRAFAAEAVAAMAGIELDEAEDLLAELHDANLLECNDRDEYRFHDLVRVHAAELRRDDPAALRRLADWYRVRGACADRAVLEPARFRVGQDEELLPAQNPFDFGTAVDWLERERVNLLAVLRTAHEHGWDRVVISLCDSPLWTLHNQHRHHRDTAAALELGVVSAERAGDAVAEARMRTLLVRMRTDAREFAAAHEEAERALAVARRSGHRRALASALEFCGQLHRAEQRWDAAVPLFEQSLALNEELGFPRAVAVQEYLLGRVLVLSGRPADGLVRLRSALQRIAEFPRDRRIPERIRVAMGRAHQQLGEHGEAVRLLREAEAAGRERRTSSDLAEPLELLGESLLRTGEAAAAREALAEALELLEQDGDPHAERVRLRLAEF